MNNLIDLTGKQFCRLVVVRRVKYSHWLCRCTCGKEKAVASGSLRSGRTRSCGCMRREFNFVRNAKHAESCQNGVHITTKEYLCWVSMNSRCYNPNNRDYGSYGGRGIRVCNRWLGVNGYTNFLNDMGRAPSPKHSIDRKDNDGNYTPLNCRWATPKQQANNRRPKELA